MVRLSLGLGLFAVLMVAGQDMHAPLQQGYAAYLRGDYETALRQYERAMAQSDDPGRWAMELGAIAAQAGRYPEASLWFSRALEDAGQLRRARAAYGQGTSLVHVASSLTGRKAVTLLRQALSLLTLAEREVQALLTEERESSRGLLGDMLQNRSVAEAMLQQKLKEPEPPEAKEQNQATPPDQQDAPSAPGKSISTPRSTPQTRSPQDQPQQEGQSSDSTAGRGNLPPLPDDETTPPLSRSEALRRLQELLQRLKQPLHQQPLRPGSKDW